MHSLVKQKENLTLRQKSLRALFHAPLQLVSILYLSYVLGYLNYRLNNVIMNRTIQP